MTRHDIKKLLAVSMLLALIKPAYADLKQDSTMIITGGKMLPKAAPRSNSNDPSMGEAFNFDTKVVNGTKRTLRCWQDGVLIVAEKDWNLMAAQAPILISDKSQKAYAFNYSDTFCLYIGG